MIIFVEYLSNDIMNFSIKFKALIYFSIKVIYYHNKLVQKYKLLYKKILGKIKIQHCFNQYLYQFTPVKYPAKSLSIIKKDKTI